MVTSTSVPSLLNIYILFCQISACEFHLCHKRHTFQSLTIFFIPYDEGMRYG
jgi:hypothetical protein